MDKVYLAIDLKSFYASVECVERGLDPLKVNLVVADESRTEKTICLAVSPALKAYGIPGRPRLFEVLEKVKEINSARRRRAPGGKFSGKSYIFEKLEKDPSLELDFIAAPPRMAFYLEYSSKIVDIYRQFVAPEDMHIYSIDEVFFDVTAYLNLYKISPKELAMKIILEVFQKTGITATAGIGPNLYLAKVAMDIVAKHVPADENGVRIAELDEFSYRKTLWAHEPITDFWRVGKGYQKRLLSRGMTTMGDVARCSLRNEDLLYSLFGVNAELLIDHAWGWEPCTIAEIKAYRPRETSLASGQVLSEPYSFEKGLLVLKEMATSLALDLEKKGLMTDQIVLTVGYDRENLKDPARRKKYTGEVVFDRYGREIPKHAHGTAHVGEYTSLSAKLTKAAAELYKKIVSPDLTVRRLNLTYCRLRGENAPRQLDIFTSLSPKESAKEQKEQALQETVLKIQEKFGKNSLVKGLDLEEGATAIERNNTIGGHKK